MKHSLAISTVLFGALFASAADAAVRTRDGSLRLAADDRPEFCPPPGEIAGESESVIERVVRLPGRVLQRDRSEVRSRLRDRIRSRLEQARSRVWMAPGGSCWFTSYAAAYRAAQCDRKMLLVYFVPEQYNSIRNEFEASTLTDPNVTQWLAHFTCVRIPVTEPHLARRGTALVSDPAFEYLRNRPGLAMIDLVGDVPAYNGQVTFVRPFTKSCSSFELATILGLPRASLTQRTMIYAVRMHPERPQSTSGQLSAYLLDQAESHSQHQANIQVQGHHNWDTRFHQISSRLGSVFSAKEVVAESWGHEDLLEAAIECVHSWRQSPGHWSAVNAPHRFYGYDMKRGANGKWYGTGIFGDTSVSNRHG